MVRGGYTFDQIVKMDFTEILFLHHYQELNKRMNEEFITQALGILWNKEDFIEKSGKAKANKNFSQLFIPLSMAINPDIQEYVKKQFHVSNKPSGTPAYIGGGSYMPKPNEVVNSLDALSKDEFMKMIGRRR